MTMLRIGSADDVPMLEGRNVTVDGRRIAVFRTPEGWRAIGGSCPHQGGPLADGIVADHCVTCPLHGWRFDLDTGEAVNGDASVELFEVTERAGELWLRLPAARLPEAA